MTSVAHGLEAVTSQQRDQPVNERLVIVHLDCDGVHRSQPRQLSLEELTFSAFDVNLEKVNRGKFSARDQ